MSTSKSASGSAPPDARVGPARKPHSAPESHNQFIRNPVGHFRSLPWAAALLDDPAVLDTIVVDRRPLDTGESNFVRRTMNSGTTVRACVTFFRMLRSPAPRGSNSSNNSSSANNNGGQKEVEGITKSKALLAGGGAADGEDPKNPFLLFNALLDLGEDLCSYQGTLHGGLIAVLMDEVMGTAANFQSENGAYTVQFNTRFHRPIKLPQVILVRARVIKREGRKIHLRGAIEDKDGNLMAEADGVWIQMGKNIGRSQL